MSTFYGKYSQKNKVERTNLDLEMSRICSELAAVWLDDDEWVVRVGRGTTVKKGITLDGEVSYVPGICWNEDKIIEMDGNMVPEDFQALKVRYRFPYTYAAIKAFHGILVHEIGHAEFTKWDEELLLGVLKEGKGAVINAFKLLEEPRMEGRVVDEYYERKVWLQSATAEKIIPNLMENIEKADPSSVCALILARADAGILEHTQIKALWDLMEERLGSDILEQARALWKAALRVEDEDNQTLLDIAAEWVELFDLHDNEMNDGSGEPCEEEGEGENGEGEGTSGGEAEEDESGEKEDSNSGKGESGEDKEGDSEGDGSGNEDDSDSENSEDKSDDELTTVLTEVTEIIKAAADEEIGLESETKHRPSGPSQKGALANTEDASASMQESIRVSKEIFHGDGGYSERDINVRWMEPSSIHRHNANRISQFMKNHLYRPAARTRVITQTPGGKLRSRQAMELHAQRSLGLNEVAKPWKVKEHKKHPPLRIKVGFACDQSGSMINIINDLTGAAWSISNALKPFDASFSAVTFGERVAPLVNRGAIMKKVPIISADAGHEAAGVAFRALDGSLGMCNPGKEVKLMFIFSDGWWVNKRHWKEGRQMLDRLRANGVKTFMVYNEVLPQEHLHGCTPLIINGPDWVDVFMKVLSAEVR